MPNCPKCGRHVIRTAYDTLSGNIPRHSVCPPAPRPRAYAPAPPPRRLQLTAEEVAAVARQKAKANAERGGPRRPLATGGDVALALLLAAVFFLIVVPAYIGLT